MGSSRSDESGQIIVVAALLLAVLFVGLALVLNSAIYAENAATRGDTSTRDAMAVETLTAFHLEAAIDAENYGTEEATYAARLTRLEANVSEWNSLVGPQEARTGSSYSVALTAATNGTRVNQSAPDYFEPANASVLDADPLGLGDSTNWQAANESEVRAFRMTVRRDSLRQVDSNLTTELTYLLEDTLTGSDRFWTEFEGDDSYRMYLLDDHVNDSVAVVVTEYNSSGDDTLLGVCSAAVPQGSDNVTVRITDAEIDGPGGTTDCPPLEGIDDGRQNVYYVGGDHAYGTYRFLADRRQGPFRADVADAHDSLLAVLTLSDDDVYADSPTDQDPYTTTAIYGLSVETTYRDGRVTAVHNTTYPPTAR